MQEDTGFIATLAGKEKSNRSFFTTHHILTIIAVILLVVAVFIGQFAWNLPQSVKCYIVSSDTASDTAVIRSNDLPDDVQLKVKVDKKKPVQDNPWRALLGSLFRGSVNESVIVDASAVTPNDDGTYDVSFSSPYDSYSISAIFYSGEPQGLLDML